MIEHLYRYELKEYAVFDPWNEYAYKSDIPNPKLQLIEYNVWRETPCGYWFGYGRPVAGSLRSEGRWVSKTGKKRYVYPTKEEALNGFNKRNERRMKILKRQLEVCRIGSDLSKKINFALIHKQEKAQWEANLDYVTEETKFK